VESAPTNTGQLAVLRLVGKIISKVGFFSESRLLFCSENLKKPPVKSLILIGGPVRELGFAPEDRSASLIFIP
jgi:hypothetical protein